MTEVGSAYVSILPSAKGFGSKLNTELSGGADKAGRNAGKRAGEGIHTGMAGPLRKIGGLLAGAFVVTKAASFFKEAVAGASDLNESASKVSVVFGKNSGVVTKFAKNAAVSMGITQQAALEAAGTFGNLFVALKLPQKASATMSTSLVKLAGDLASFNNVDPAQAMDALRSGLAGETEPLKRFGVNMNDATLKAQAFKLGLISSVKDAMTPAAKAQAAYALILEQTKTAQGDFTRTSGGLANQQRIMAAQWGDLKAKVGSGFLPVAISVTKLLNNVLIPGLTRTGKALSKSLGPAFRSVVGAAKVFFSFLNGNDTGVDGPFRRAAVAGEKLRHAIKATFGALKVFFSFLKGNDTGVDGPFRKAAIAGDALHRAFLRVSAFVTGTLIPAFKRFGQFLNSSVLPVVKRIGKAIATNFLPTLSAIGEFIGTKVIPPLARLGGMLAEDLAPAFASLSKFVTQRVMPALKGLWVRFQDVLPTLEKVGIVVLKVVGVLLVLAAKIIGVVIPILLKLAGPVFTLLFAIVGKAIGVVAALARAFAVGFKAIAAAVDFVRDHWKVFLGILAPGVLLLIKHFETFRRIGESAFGAVGRAIGAIKTVVGAVASYIGSRFATVITFIRSLPGKISTATSGMWDGIKNAFKAALNWIIDKWNGLQFSVPGVSAFGHEIGGFTLGTPDIPRLAAGGIVTRPTLSLIGEAGPEAVIPLRLLHTLNIKSHAQPADMPTTGKGGLTVNGGINVTTEEGRAEESVPRALRNLAWAMDL